MWGSFMICLFLDTSSDDLFVSKTMPASLDIIKTYKKTGSYVLGCKGVDSQIASRYGIKGNIFYRLITVLYVYLIPIIPDVLVFWFCCCSCFFFSSAFFLTSAFFFASAFFWASIAFSSSSNAAISLSYWAIAS